MRKPILLVLLMLGSPLARAEDGVTDTEIVLGSSAAYHGASAALGVEQWRGFMAYFDQINAEGGVHGRKIRVVAYDDAYDPLYAVPNTLKLLEKDKVFALFGYVGTPTLVRALPVLRRFEDRNAFLFSNFTGAQPQRDAPYDKLVYNVRASYREETAGLVEHLVKLGYKRIALYLQDDAYGKSGEDGVKRALASRSLEPVKSTTYKRGMQFGESAEAQAQLVLDAKADAVIAIGAYEGCAAFIRDVRKKGFSGPIANVSFVGPDTMLDLLSEYQKKEKQDVTHRLINSQVVPNWRDATLPLVKEYQAAMDRLGKKMPQVPPAGGNVSTVEPRRFSFTSLEGYVDARLLVEVLKRAGRDLTRESFRKAAESMGAIDLGGVSLRFSATDHQALHRVWYTTVRGSGYETIQDWQEALK